jgi:hypothetical protein
MQLTRAHGAPSSKNLVFTSAGDFSNVRLWLEGRHRDFDLWVTYYGDEHHASLRSVPEYFVTREGTKFQNLHYCYSQWPELFAHYEAVMVMDDDIIIGADAITRLFDIRREFDLWALQPAFRVSGKISWDITRVRPTARLRYTNFVEMTCPLFRRDKLDSFMAVYEPEIIGYGEDWWFLRTLGPDLDRHVAVVDEVPCVNPHDRRKGGRREIDRVSSHEERKAVWERIKLRHNLDERGRAQAEYGRIEKPRLDALIGMARLIPETTYVGGRRMLRRLLHNGHEPTP